MKSWNVRKEYGCPDLHGKLDIATIINHIVESLLHIGTKMCPILQDDAMTLARR